MLGREGDVGTVVKGVVGGLVDGTGGRTSVERDGVGQDHLVALLLSRFFVFVFFFLFWRERENER